MRRRAVFVVLALTTWVAGSALGAMSGTVEATAQAIRHRGRQGTRRFHPVAHRIQADRAAAGRQRRATGRRRDALPRRLAPPRVHQPGEAPSHAGGHPPRLLRAPSPTTARARSTTRWSTADRPCWSTTVEDLPGSRSTTGRSPRSGDSTDMINGVGGLTIDVPFPMSDSYARADFQPGVQELTGKEALAFSRDRHEPRAGRLRAAGERRTPDARLAGPVPEGVHEATQSRLFMWLGSGMRNVETDGAAAGGHGSSPSRPRHIPAKSVQNVVLPGSAGHRRFALGGHLDWQRARPRSSTTSKADGILVKKNVPPSPTAGE